MRIVLTGGAGFIGSHLAERLATGGHEVVIYDSFAKQYAEAVKRRNVATALSLPGCTLIEGNVLDGQRFDSAFSSHAVDVLIHAAATVHVPGADPVRAVVEANVLGLQSVIERCLRHNVGRLVLVSSSAVYGAPSGGLCRETDPTDRQLSVYAAAKKMAETLAWLAHHQHGLAVRVLRPFSVYGPRQRPDQVIHRLARALMAGECVELPGDGSAALDLVYIDDVVEGLARATESVEGYEVLNLGTGRGTTLRDLVDRLAALLGAAPDVRACAADATFPESAIADPSAAEKRLGWRAVVELEEGLRRFTTWERAEEFADEA